MSTQAPISHLSVEYKLGYSQPIVHCVCGASIDLNKARHKTKAGEAFRMAHEECGIAQDVHKKTG